MKMHHAVFHRRLIGADLVIAALEQHAPSAVHTLRNDVVLMRGLEIGGSLGLDEIALEQGDFFRVIELHHIGGVLRRARNERRHHQYVRIPLQHHVRVVQHPDGTEGGVLAFAIVAYRFMPAFVDWCTGTRKIFLDPDHLHREGVGEFPAQVIAGNEVAQPGMERFDVVVLEIDLDEGLPVLLVLGDLHMIEAIAGEVEFPGQRQRREIARYIAFAVEQQALPALQRRTTEIEAGVVREVWCAKQLAVHVVSPAMQRADDVTGIAATFQHDSLPMPADVGQELYAVGIAHQQLAVILPGKAVIVARLGHHQLVPDIARTAIEKQLLLQFEHLLVKVPADGQLRCTGLEPSGAGQIGHTGGFLLGREGAGAG